MAQQESIDILEFQRRFGTDDACRDHLYKIRWPEGPSCAKCGGGNFGGVAQSAKYDGQSRHMIETI